MKISFNVTGSERKRLVQTVSDSCGENARYLGMPSMAYEIGPFTVTKDGTLEFSEDVDGSIRTRLLFLIISVKDQFGTQGSFRSF